MSKVNPTSMHLGTYKMGCLNDITTQEICDILGFKTNVTADPAKVVNSWAFEVELPNGTREYAAIWDYKGSHKWNQFSTWGAADVFYTLFPGRYKHGAF